MSSVDSLDSLMTQLRALADQAQGVKVPDKSAAGPDDFANTLKSMVGSVNNQQSQAGALQSDFSNGDKSVSLSQVMVASQKADLSFQTMLQVRNKLVSAYQDIMNIQA
ncbi:flagellar hook-basal body complex protein FliE [Acidithiobacillus thiooxidans]|uniref:Flagellar hook-basal body complex protein FliE n=1 Tax=Acidithiobacillus thiooxidans ATCC 19377 TaxID=637390 RepID=A0A543Q7S6_ACITH|nr:MULTISPECIES: flagellar hook-basal body complex protein FliE [Acidithiobacillus]MBU2842959.1 flagellar hook-basal body complex protein FliE [Acidithiobacillus thiooxidans]MDR7927845.1 flagellar hook-basal body complex protein FliE [Acidithiobacillus thiooxidans]MDX5936098.1 flagellar hook-basal body complex protein FliE [Acidithiobacillus thiooxidans]TQN52397.1 Flagellar hook-basal body complex protein FliE [Acidithiobacillus thiooxidans ATCC 19377]